MFCPHCKGQDIIKAGYRLSVRSGKKQRYQCTTCYKTFYGEEE
ncbi:IS1/IS1595 family N-terminal zinc-binding domain-containing protein [Methanosarcina mazei]